MNKLIQRVNDINELDKNVFQQETKMNMVDKCLEYMKQASSIKHSLFSLFDR